LAHLKQSAGCCVLSSVWLRRKKTPVAILQERHIAVPCDIFHRSTRFGGMHRVDELD
jgi:hypothetical protein